MKKTLLLSVVLTTAFFHAYPQSQNLTPSFWQNYEPSKIRPIQSRGEFPVLLLDSAHCLIYSSESPYPLTQELFDTYQYDAQERQIKFSRHIDIIPIFFSELTHTTYTYDAQGRLIESLLVVDLGSGNIQNKEKTETTYSPDDLSSEEIISQWDITDWLFSRRSLRDHDAQGRIVQRIEQYWDGSAWVNAFRYMYDWDANNNATLYRSEQWEPVAGAWHIVSEQSLTYDSDSKLLSVIFGFGTIDEPFELAAKEEYHYNAQDLNDYIDFFTWDEGLNQWAANAKEVNSYNAQGKLEETLRYTVVNQVLNEESRTLLTYDDNAYNELPKDRFFQVWQQGAFKDKEHSISQYMDLPNGQVHRTLEFYNQYTPGSGNWQIGIDCDLLYNLSTISNVAQPSTQVVCPVPNPYPPGTNVMCPLLEDDQPYELRVYSLDGRVAYLRKFNGADGWSIEQHLPGGAYIVVVACNGKQISAQKIVFE